MSTKTEPAEGAGDGGGKTTVEIQKRPTRRALGKLQNEDETLGDTIDAALAALKEKEPERLQVEV